MTAEEKLKRIDTISKYANGVYYRNREVLGCFGELFEDFREDMILYALLYPEDSPAMVLRRLRFAKQCQTEAIPLKIENMKTFSELAETRGIDESEFIELICGMEEDRYFEENDAEKWLATLGGRLFKTEERNELFQDYMYGMSVGGRIQRDMRQVLFNRRFMVLDFLKEFYVITLSEWERWKTVAEEMTEPAPVKRNRAETSTAQACRRYYEKNKAYFAEKAKRYAEKRKAEKSAI